MMKFLPHILFESRISGLKRIFIRPVRDYMWVETMNSPNTYRAVRYGICKNSDLGSKHIAYQPVGGRIEIDRSPGNGTTFTIPLEKQGQYGF